jgi:dTDP-4-dehydrorhamnose reductase
MRLLITGAAGMLGQDVGAVATAAGLETVALAQAELDVTDDALVQEALFGARPDVVVNCAAWTDVDGAEAHDGEALAVNGAGAGNIARAAERIGAWTVHISSDYVFDGTKREPYVESDPASPLSAYGRSKLAGEVEVAREAPERHTIVRSSWLFGTGGRSFPGMILSRCGDREKLSVVNDQVGCPTFSGHLARAVVELASTGPPLGVVHIAGAGSCSWYELALEIVRAASLDCEVEPCSTADVPRPARRPAYSVLGTERPGETPGLPHWHEGLEEYIALTVPSR